MKIGRNDPCPCGSGRKFKKCCAPSTAEASAAAAEAPSADSPESAETAAETTQPTDGREGRLRVKTWTPIQDQQGALWPSRMSRKKPK
jgi:hypothetical protein